MNNIVTKSVFILTLIVGISYSIVVVKGSLNINDVKQNIENHLSFKISTPTRKDIIDFSKTIKGDVLFDDDVKYKNTTNHFNLYYKNNPSFIVLPVDEDDLVKIVKWKNQFKDLAFTVKGAGHSYTGMSSISGGMLVSTSKMNKVKFDSETKTFTFQSGCSFNDILPVCKTEGYCPPTGDCIDVGMGFYFGGGKGMLSRRDGLGIDLLKQVRIVTANGKVITASETSNKDLFWALRGGGAASFGIVSELQIAAKPMVDEETVVFSATVTMEDAFVLLPYLYENEPTFPKNVGFYLEGPISGIDVMFVWISDGVDDNAEAGTKFFESLNSSLPVKLDSPSIVTTSFLAAAREVPKNLGYAFQVNAGMLKSTLTKDDIVEYLELFHELAKMKPDSAMLEFSFFGGNINNEQKLTDTAFPWRESRTLSCFYAMCPGASGKADTCQDSLKALDGPFREKMEKFFDGGYFNYKSTSSHIKQNFYFGDKNFEKLKAVKRKYDPNGIFCNKNLHLHQCIPLH